MRSRNLLLCVLGASLACASAAQAAGGGSISSAPTVAYGQQLFGNTATDSSSTTCGGSEKDSWWLLQVTAGDRVKVDFEGNGGHYERSYPVGTTDFTVENTSYVQRAALADNGKQEGVIDAAQSGAMPLRFSTDDCNFDTTYDPGPYDFTAFVQHKAILALPHLKAKMKLPFFYTVGVHNPDGNPVNDPGLRMTLLASKAGAKFKQIASGSPSNGSIRFKVPVMRGARGKSVRLQVRAGGSDWRNAAATSRAFVVK